MSKNKHGGKRQDAGRKLKYGESTVMVRFKVPESHELAIKEAFKKILKKYIIKK